MQQGELLSRVNELPQIKKVLQELVELVNQEDVDFHLLSQKIALEQVVSAKVLRLANSAHFGRSRTVASIDEAVVRLGMAPIKTMVIVSVLSSAFPKFETMDIHQYWSDTFEVATIASYLAKKVRLDANQAFTAGVLHNIGELMIHSLAPDFALEIAHRIENGEEASLVQNEILGTTSTRLGAKLATAWKFGPELTDSIAHYLVPDQAEEDQRMASLLHLAFRINRDWASLESEQEQYDYLDASQDLVALGLSPEEYEGINCVIGKGEEIATQMMG
ncbi:HDOD domain-containing protein [Vibrio sp. SCSIO 43136]|uniref:HDOD domain-containing protein n=1 Tax=Vibrio sp. SCSIO 43136 TaxID=2819101 RepID=UPI002075D50A|nr:HDOD domain-containing protein [Vibrio sp. SCSIO 43136]USD65597.1 HDOD domain-containing protein [Vibrio sp. SCSIO 43136]